MCGITGFLDFSKSSSIEDLNGMVISLEHRGPDDCGVHFSELSGFNLGLGHTRLSILDLSNHGRQPMSFEHLTMVYNGEVYNFKEVRAELEVSGYQFESGSDTEVILKAFHLWGVEALHKFNGMFAIALFDSKQSKLYLFRDRSGVKPLFYSYQNGVLLFSSEIKSFHNHPSFKKVIDHNAVGQFFKYGYIPEPYSIFEGTHKLLAGHYIEFDITSASFEVNKYWDVVDFYNLPKFEISEEDALAETEKLLSSAFEYRMVADVPVGVFLSGGYDSSAVAAILQSNRASKLKTFTIGFEEQKYNEAEHAKKVANFLGTDHVEYYCTQKDALDILPTLRDIWDEPFGDPSSIPTTLVSQLARKEVTVSLSADGGDEIFAGYSKYNGIRAKHDAFSKLPSFSNKPVEYLLRNKQIHKLCEKAGIHNAQDRLNRFSTMLGADEQRLLALSSCTFTELELALLLKQKPEKLTTNFDLDIDAGWLSNVLATDYKTYMLDNILTKVDRATMSVSLEGREPLLDYRIIEFAAQLPDHLKLNQKANKYILKEIVHKYIPKEIMDRPKMGFGVPLFEWFKDELKEYFMTYLSRERLNESGLFNVEYAIKLRDSYLAGEQANINKLWYLLVFEMWRERWMRQKP